MGIIVLLLALGFAALDYKHNKMCFIESTIIGIIAFTLLGAIISILLYGCCEQSVDTRMLSNENLIAITDDTRMEGNISGNIFMVKGQIGEEYVYKVMEGNNTKGYRYVEYKYATCYIHMIKNNEQPRVEVIEKNYKYENELIEKISWIKPNSEKETHIYVPEGSILCNDYTIDLE
jgi:hypothetical protein